VTATPHRVLVTGGSRGIGSAIATRLGNAGLQIDVGYRQSKAEAEAIVAAIQQTGDLIENKCLRKGGKSGHNKRDLHGQYLINGVLFGPWAKRRRPERRILAYGLYRLTTPSVPMSRSYFQTYGSIATQDSLLGIGLITGELAGRV